MRSRSNGLKHGLTGAGVALPIEDAAEVERRYRALGDDLRPVDQRERDLVRRAAFLSVRVERCEKFETAALTEAIRTAVDDYDEAIHEAVEGAVEELSERPAASVRRLCRTPEGIDWRLGTWAELRRDIPLGYWGVDHVLRAELLLGRRNDLVGHSMVNTLTAAMKGDFRLVDPMGAEPTTDPDALKACQDAGRADLEALIDAEVDRLRGRRASLDLEAIARSRAEAPLRRLFNPSNASLLFRRYETAAARELFKILALFPMATEDGPESTSSDESAETCDELGSCGGSAASDPLPPAEGPEVGVEAAEAAGPEDAASPGEAGKTGSGTPSGPSGGSTTLTPALSQRERESENTPGGIESFPSEGGGRCQS